MTRDTVRLVAKRTAQGLVAFILFGCGLLPVGPKPDSTRSDGGVATGGGGSLTLAIDAVTAPARVGTLTPANGRTFLEVALALTNTSAAHAVGLDRAFFRVSTDTGLDVQASGATSVAQNPCAADLSVATGGTARCHVVFELPSGAHGTRLSYDDGQGDTTWSGLPAPGTGGGSGLKKNFMLLVDKSASMNDPIDSSNITTKLEALKAGLGNFVASSGAAVRLGLALFPTDSMCGATASITRDLPSPSTADDGAATDACATASSGVLSSVQAITPAGGTPTSISLAFLGSAPSFTSTGDGRSGVVVLITDGLPNCNPSNPNTCADPLACQCTLSSCGFSGSTFCTTGCLDQAASVAQIRALKSQGISTAVVGIGASVGGNTALTLSAMAREGGLACTGPARCLSGAWHVSSAADLAAVLADITGASAAP